MILTDEKTGIKYNPKRFDIGGTIVYELEEIPKFKPVDMSVFVVNGIDCCFFNDSHQAEVSSGTTFGAIHKIKGGYTDYNEQTWKYCKPRMNYHWITHHNFKRNNDEFCDIVAKIVDAGFKVEYSYAGHTGYLNAFTITGLQEGYCWPWTYENLKNPE